MHSCCRIWASIFGPYTKMVFTFRIDQMFFCETFRTCSYVSSFCLKKELYIGQGCNRKVLSCLCPPSLSTLFPSNVAQHTGMTVSIPLLRRTRSSSQLGTDSDEHYSDLAGKREAFLIVPFTISNCPLHHGSRWRDGEFTIIQTFQSSSNSPTRVRGT